MTRKLTAAQLAARTEARQALRELFPIGSTVSTQLLYVSKSGMLRSVAVMFGRPDGTVRNVSPLVAIATGEKMHKTTHGVSMGGCGMDMGFSLVYGLARALYSDQRDADTFARLRTKRDAGEAFEPYERQHLTELENDDRVPFMCQGPRGLNCPSNDHVNEWQTPNYSTTRLHSDAGYAVSQRWI